MKKLILIILFFSGISTAKAQLVVNDPGNMAINAAIQTASEASSKLQNFMAQVEKMSYATDVLESMQSLRQIADLLDQLICIQTEFQLLYNGNKQYSCATFLNIQLVTFNVAYTTDIVNKVVLAKNLLTMKQAEHLNVMENIRKVLENTIKEMQHLNASMRMDIKQKAMKRYVKKNYYSNSQNVAFNRYKK